MLKQLLLIQPVKNIVSIRSGVFLKSDIAPDTVYLQAKHFTEDGELAALPFPEISMCGRLEKHQMETGDVLFVAKGYHNFAALYPPEAGLAVASSTFLILKIRGECRNLLLPEYLVAILNHPSSQERIKARATGSNPPSVTKSELEEIEIPIPSIEKQHTFVQLQRLLRKEIQIKQQLEQLNEKLLQQKLLKAITN